MVDFADRNNEAPTNQKVKSLIDFDDKCSSSIRSIALKKSSKVNLTSRFLNGKMKIYKKNKINRCYLYQNLTDTDSTSVFFIFICNLSGFIREDEARDIIFEFMIQRKIFDRLNLSAEL